MEKYFNLNDIKLWQYMEASKSRENYKKYATSKKASLKRKKRGKRNK